MMDDYICDIYWVWFITNTHKTQNMTILFEVCVLVINHNSNDQWSIFRSVFVLVIMRLTLNMNDVVEVIEPVFDIVWGVVWYLP